MRLDDKGTRKQISPHPVFEREGRNIHVITTIPLATALLGGVVRVPTVDGDVEITLPPGTQPGTQKVLRARGIAAPLDGRGGMVRGDQWVNFSVEIPRITGKREQELLREALLGIKPEAPAEAAGGGERRRATAAADKAEDKAEAPEPKGEGEGKRKGGIFSFIKDKLCDTPEEPEKGKSGGKGGGKRPSSASSAAGAP